MEIKEFLEINKGKVSARLDNALNNLDFHYNINDVYKINKSHFRILRNVGNNTIELFLKLRDEMPKEKTDGGICIANFKTPKHYDNSKGSIYQFCENQNLNSWEFDIIKRTVRCRKKGNFKEDLEKTKHLIDLYLKEYELHN